MSGPPSTPADRSLREENIVAALYVETDGVYFGLLAVDPWDEKRDARGYAGPYRDLLIGLARTCRVTSEVAA